MSTGQPGSMHDTSVLYNALSVDEKFFPHPPKGKNNVNNLFTSIDDQSM